jgi:dimethylsulfoniopropionate demethylase
MMEHAAPSACETSPRRDETAGVETVPTPALAISLRTGRTPYSPRVEAQGVRSYTVYNHTLLPAVFRSLEEDYRHLKRHVQIWDVSCEQQVEVRGAEAARLVQLMTPRDLSKATIGQCLYAPLVDEAGGMINDPVILKLTEDRFWISISDSDVLLWAKGLAVGRGAGAQVRRLAGGRLR